MLTPINDASYIIIGDENKEHHQQSKADQVNKILFFGINRFSPQAFNS